MNKIIILITLVPWLLYYIFLSRNNIIKLRENHYVLSNFNIRELLPIKNILLYIVYITISVIYKDSNQIELVNSLLFSTINLFLFIYSYYDNKEYELDLSTKEVLYLGITTIITSIILLISISIKETYNILFAYSIINIIILYISKKIINIVRRINHEIKQL